MGEYAREEGGRGGMTEQGGGEAREDTKEGREERTRRRGGKRGN